MRGENEPRSRIHPWILDIQRTWNTLRLSRNPCQRFRSCSRNGRGYSASHCRSRGSLACSQGGDTRSLGRRILQVYEIKFEKQHALNVPFVASHRVGIVCIHSSREMVNPRGRNWINLGNDDKRNPRPLPYTLLLSCMNLKGSYLRSQKYCTFGLWHPVVRLQRIIRGTRVTHSTLKERTLH